jgi:hypothetical protein
VHSLKARLQTTSDKIGSLRWLERLEATKSSLLAHTTLDDGPASTSSDKQVSIIFRKQYFPAIRESFCSLLLLRRIDSTRLLLPLRSRSYSTTGLGCPRLRVEAMLLTWYPSDSSFFCKRNRWSKHRIILHFLHF